MKSRKHLEIVIEDARWRRMPRLQTRLEAAARATLARLPKTLPTRCAITLLLTSDAAIRRLNRDFLGVDKPTNVLAFPQFAPRQMARVKTSNRPVYAGDIAISYQYSVAEAKKDRKITVNHITHLLIHGILHLFGYDHISDAKAGRMEGLEKKIMADLSLPNPYKSDRNERPRINKH